MNMYYVLATVLGLGDKIVGKPYPETETGEDHVIQEIPFVTSFSCLLCLRMKLNKKKNQAKRQGNLATPVCLS